MNGKKRWETAQHYERKYWKNIAQGIMVDSKKQLTWYGWKAGEFEKRLNSVTCSFDRGNCRVMEIGSGPVGIVSYLSWGEKYALDPLAEFYRDNPLLVELRPSNVRYINGIGEEIPFPDGYFSVVIIDNVLDHVQAPDLVLEQISRVLSNDGILYVELNIHTSLGYALHRLLSKTHIDKGHPHSYTVEKIRLSLKLHGFNVLSELTNDYGEARDRDRKSRSLKAKLKGYTGMSEFIYSAACSKLKIEKIDGQHQSV